MQCLDELYTGSLRIQHTGLYRRDPAHNNGGPGKACANFHNFLQRLN